MSEFFFKFPKESKTAQKYKKAIEFESYLLDLWETFSQTHGIESQKIYVDADRLAFEPTTNDARKFGDQFLRDSNKLKARSELNKAWLELVKDIEFFERPFAPFLFNGWIGKIRTMNFFDHEEEIYYMQMFTECSLKPEELKCDDEYISILGSEYYAAHEQLSQKENA